MDNIAQHFPFAGLENVRYVALSIDSNYGGVRDALGEVRFATGLVPFPLTITPDDGGGYNLDWDSQDGMLYNLYSTADLSEALVDWDLVEGDIPATGTGTNIWNVSSMETTLFYRVEEFPAPPVIVFEDNFDGADPGWDTDFDAADTLENTVWALGSPAVPGPPAANSAPNCYGTNLTANYGTESNTWLRTPPINLSTATAATLVFQHWVDMDDFDTGDTGTVRVLDASALPTVTVLETLEFDIQGLSPTGWVEFSKDLTGTSLGNSVMLEFLFVSDNVPDADASGWYIDDVVVTASGS